MCCLLSQSGWLYFQKKFRHDAAGLRIQQTLKLRTCNQKDEEPDDMNIL